MTTRTNLYVDQGTDFLVSLDLKEETGSDYTISGNQYFCNVAKLYSTSVKFSADLTVNTDDPANDLLEFYISADKTKELEPGKYTYDIMMVDAGGSISKIMEGLIFILPSRTIIDLEE